MLWEMLVGRRLFTGEDTRSTLAAVLFGQVPRPRSLRAKCRKDLERVTMKLLERDLPARYATAELAVADLLECENAPKNGRELLTAMLAERFPELAPVRQTARLATAPPKRSAGRRSVADGSRPGHGRGDAAAAMPSLGAVRAAADRHARRRVQVVARSRGAPREAPRAGPRRRADASGRSRSRSCRGDQARHGDAGDGSRVGVTGPRGIGRAGRFGRSP